MHLGDNYPIKFTYPCTRCAEIINIVRDRALKGDYTTMADLQEAFTQKRGNNGKRGSISDHVNELKRLGYITITNLISVTEYTKNCQVEHTFVSTKQKGISLNAFELYLQMIKSKPSLLWEWLEQTDLDEFSWGLSTKELYKCKVCDTHSSFKIEADICSTCGHRRGEIYTYKCLKCGFSFILTRSFPYISKKYKNSL